MTWIALFVVAAGLTTVETCAPPGLQPSPHAEVHHFLHEAPFLAMENPVDDPVPDGPGHAATMARLLKQRIAELHANIAVGAHRDRPQSRTRWLYSHATGWIQVPASLRVHAAAVGVDGSWLLEMADAQGSVRLRATGTGACVGCAMTSAALWFPEQMENARRNEFLLCERFVPAPEILNRKGNRVRWQRLEPDSGLLLEGVVVDRTADDEGLRTLTVGGLDHRVSAAVLDGFAR